MIARVALVLAGMSGAAAALNLIGWLAAIPVLAHPVHGSAMQFNTALSLLLIAAAVIAQPYLHSRWITVVATVVVAVLAGGAVAAYVTGRPVDLDQLGFALGVPDAMRPFATDMMVYEGRMAPHTAIALLALAAGITMLEFRWRRGWHASVYLGALASALGVLGLFSYASDAAVPAGWAHVSRIALTTAVVLIALGAALSLRGWVSLRSSGAVPYMVPLLATIAGVTVSIGGWQMLADAGDRSPAGLAGPLEIAHSHGETTVVLVIAIVLSGVLGLVLLLWERTRSQAFTLAQSADRLRLALAGANDGLFDWDVAHSRVYYSPRWKAMLGYAESELPDTIETWSQLLHPDDRDHALQVVDEFRQGTEPLYSLEHRLRHKDGTYRWILARALGLRNKRGELVRLVGAHTDLTDRKEAELELARSRWLAGIGSTVLTVMHEINNPLTSLLMNAEVLAAGERDPATVRAIVAAAHRIADVTRQLSVQQHDPRTVEYVKGMRMLDLREAGNEQQERRETEQRETDGGKQSSGKQTAGN